MGTSSSYKGSTSKVSRELRDGVEEWVQCQTDNTKTSIPENVIAQALKIPVFPRRSSGNGDGSGSTAGGGASGGGRKQSAPRRNAHTYAATARRAADLARAFREGDRATLKEAGLDFDKLSALPSRHEMVRKILDVVCEAQTSSDIPNEEQRDIAGKLLDWMLDSEQNPITPDATATAEHAIGLIIAEIFISESGEFTSGRAVTREEFIANVKDTSKHLAAKANLSKQSAPRGSVDKAIESGLKYLRRIYRRSAE